MFEKTHNYNMTQNNPEHLGAFASRLTKEGGQCAMQWFRMPCDIELKKDNSPVTIADRTTEALLRKRILQQYPDHGLLGEEFGSEHLQMEYVWSIDPIDGTRSFITGNPQWGTQVAALRKGVAVAGSVDLPALGEHWYACQGGGCWFSSRQQAQVRCSTSHCTSLSAAKFYTTSPLYFDPPEQLMLHELLRTVQEPRFGGDCYMYCLLASGYIDLVVESQLHPFDYLPLISLITEAGGVITDWQGAPLTMQSNGRVIVAATRELHRETMDFLRQQGC